MAVSTSALSASCRAAAGHAFLRANPGEVLDDAGYMTDPRRNLVPRVRFEDIEADLRQGDGGELQDGPGGRRAKFRAAHSSTALAVNVFGAFRHSVSSLRLPVGGNFTSIHFERKCPHGIGQGNPPNLDVLIEGPGSVLGIESKFLEPIGDHKSEFKPVYDQDLKGARRETPWFRMMQELMANPRAYRRLHAAQLVKHAFGLAWSFPDRRTTLAYVFWEPSNPDSHPLFAEHRAEVARFAAAVQGGETGFVYFSYPELWDRWEEQSDGPCWLVDHLTSVRDRYRFSIT